MVRTGAENGGWQLNAVNTVSVLPGGVTCTSGSQPFGPGSPCFDAPAAVALSILTNGTYPTENITGNCPPACTAGAGGMDRHHSKLPYAEQASIEIDRQMGHGLTVDVGYLYVGAHRLIGCGAVAALNRGQHVAVARERLRRPLRALEPARARVFEQIGEEVQQPEQHVVLGADG